MTAVIIGQNWDGYYNSRGFREAIRCIDGAYDFRLRSQRNTHRLSRIRFNLWQYIGLIIKSECLRDSALSCLRPLDIEFTEFFLFTGRVMSVCMPVVGFDRHLRQPDFSSDRNCLCN